MITRCPACQTLFRVVPDQLRISEGWVRCGQCDEIFDASQHLQSAALPELLLPEPQPQQGHLETGAEPHSRQASQDVVADTGTPDLGLIFPDDPELLPAPIEPAAVLADGAPLMDEMSVSGLAQFTHASDPIDANGFAPRLAEALAIQSDAAASWAQPPQVEPVFEPEPLVALPPELPTRVPSAPQASFMQTQAQPSAWHRLWVRISLALLGLLLLAGLALQAIVHERDRIAAMAPQSRPWLVMLCGVLGCEVLPLRQIDAIVIDSSAFTKVNNETYRLNVGIKNTSTLMLALPAFELTLTDTQDQALLRRVLPAKELGTTASVLAPGAEWAGVVSISVHGQPNPERIAGYRILAFYP